MALFKIFKGNSNKLGAAPTAGGQDTRAAHEGFAYFTPDDGKFYIDIADADNAIIGTNRIPLNAMCADTLKSINIHNTSPATNLDDLKDVQNQKFTSYFAGGSNTVINNPFGNGVAFGLTVYRVATGFIMQDITSAGGVRLTRYWDNTNQVWTAWRHIITSPDEGQGSTSLPIYIDSNGRTQSITSYEGNAASATKAIQDGNGNIITSTYLPLTGGIIGGNLSLTGELNVTGNAYLHNQTTIDSLTAGSLIVNGNSSFINDVSFTKIPTAPTAAAGTNNTQLATTEFVTGAVTGLAGPMRFIGTLGTGGTITTLPTAAESNKGWTYKVITKGTYGSAYAEVGDLFISNGLSWINIPSGDVPDGTVTNIATGGGLTGGPITNSGTISHADTSTQESITANANERTYITSVTLDDYGHVTALDTGTETVADTKVNVVARGTTKAYLLADTTEPTPTAVAHSAVAETGVYLDTTEATLVATTFKGALTGNADTATQVKVTNNAALPTSGAKTHFLTYVDSTTTGNQNLLDSARAYIYENTTATYLNVGSALTPGGLTLHEGNGFHGDLVTATLTANKTYTLPDASGTIALTSSNITGNAATATKLSTARKLKVALNSTADVTFDGSADQLSIPISGTLDVTHGGTSKTSWTQWGIVYASNSTTLAQVTAGTDSDYANKYQYLMSNGAAAPIWSTALTLNNNVPAIASNGSLDSLKTPGVYSVANAAVGKTITGYPNGSSALSGSKVIVFSGYTNYGHQFVLGSDIGRIFHRVQNSSSGTEWNSTWYRLVHAPSEESKVGDTNKGVYLTADGILAPTSYTVDKSVPSNAVFTDTATAADNILDGSNSGTQVTYAPYTTQQTKLSFDISTTNPTRTDRLNLNGHFYATEVYSGGTEVKTKQTAITDSTGTAEDIEATRFVYSVSQTTNGAISVKTRYYSLPTAGDNTLGGIKTGYSTSDRNYAIKVDNNGNAYVNVPWTDTNKYHKTGSWSDLTYTATAVNSADELKFTIPTGTTATTVALGNHTHTLSLATDTGTSVITLAYGDKYKLTAGGQTLIFTMPSSDNTDTKVTQNAVASTVNKDYRIILSYDANDTDAVINTVNKNTNLRYNPSLNRLSTGNLKLTGELDVTGNATFHNQTQADSLTAGSLIVTGNSIFNNDINLAQGAVKWTSNSLPSVTSADYFLVIDAFASGGATKYIEKANAIKSLISSSAIGSSTEPVYWTGSAFSAISSYEGNSATATGFASAKTIALTGNVTGSATGGNGSNGWSIATTIDNGVVTNAMLAGSIANEKLTNSSISIAGNTLSLGDSLSADTLRTSLGLSNAMHFKGTTTSTITDGSTTNPITISGSSYTASAGDVVLREVSTGNIYEYVWTGSAWEMLGRDTSFKIQQDAVDSGNVTTNKWVSRIEQDANGVVTPTLSFLDTSGTWSGNAGAIKYQDISNNNTDLNTLHGDDYAVYYAGGNNNASNAPPGVSSFGLTVKRVAIGYRLQDLIASGGSRYTRIWNGSTWTDWSRLPSGTGSGASGTWGISITGNAATATEFLAATTVALTGDATGTSAASKKGWSVPVTLANSGVTAGSYGLSANATPKRGESFNVPYFTVDSKGRLTVASTKTVTLPDWNSDVYEQYNSTNMDYATYADWRLIATSIPYNSDSGSTIWTEIEFFDNTSLYATIGLLTAKVYYRAVTNGNSIITPSLKWIWADATTLKPENFVLTYTETLNSTDNKKYIVVKLWARISTRWQGYTYKERGEGAWITINKNGTRWTFSPSVTSAVSSSNCVSYDDGTITGYIISTVNELKAFDSTGKYGLFTAPTYTANRTYTLPDKTGTIALTSDITTAVQALDVSSVGNANGSKYIAAISEIDGKISATAVDVATTYSASGTTAISGTGVAAALGTLDVAAVGGGTGEYISQISETDGKISATKTTTSVSNTWTDGTTNGPTIKTTVNGITGQAVAIPSATNAASGVVTTTTQIFAGAKTFANNVTISGTSTHTGAAAFNATGNSTHSKDTNAAVVVKGGVSVEKQISARTVRVDGTSTDNSNTTPGGVSLQYDSTLQVLNFVFS